MLPFVPWKMALLEPDLNTAEFAGISLSSGGF